MDYIEQYLTEISNRRLSAYTYKSYKTDLLQFEEFLKYRNVALEEAQNGDIKFYMSDLLRHEQSRRTISRKLSALRTFFRFLSKTKVREDDPTIGIKPPKLEKLLPKFLEPQETLDLLLKPDIKTPLGARDSAILETLYSGGLRVAELVSLKITDINFAERDMQAIRIIGKGNKERTVVLGSKAMEAIIRYVESGRPILAKNAEKEESDKLFLNRFGTEITTRSIARMLHKYIMLTSGKSGVSPHTIRHTFATHMINNGADLRTLQQLLGHSSLSTTEVYTHVTHKRKHDVYSDAHPRSKRDKGQF